MVAVRDGAETKRCAVSASSDSGDIEVNPQTLFLSVEFAQASAVPVRRLGGPLASLQLYG